MTRPPVAEHRDLTLVARRRRRWRRVVATGVGRLAAAAGGSIELAVGSFDAGHPSSRRTSFGDSTPAARARCQLAQRASGSARGRLPSVDNPPEFGRQHRLLENAQQLRHPE